MSELIKAFPRPDNSPEKFDAARLNHAAGTIVASPVPISGPAPLPAMDHDDAAANAETISLDEVFARLWRRRGTIALSALCGTLLALGISALWKPVYRARTSIRLEQLTDRFPNLREILPASEEPASDTYLQNEIKILESDELARRVADRLGIQAAQPKQQLLAGTPLASMMSYFENTRRTPGPEDLRIRAVERALTIHPALKSDVVDIYYDAADPEAAARGANAVVSEYVQINRDARVKTGRDTTEWLASQIADLKTKLDQGNAQLQSFARSAGLLYATDDTLLSEESARQVQEELSKARADRALKESRYETALSNAPEALPSEADNGLLKEYEGKLAEAEAQLTELTAMYTPAHYKVKDAQAKVEQLRTAVKQERQRIIQRMREEYDAANRLEQSLSNSFNTQTHKLTQETSDAFKYNVLKKDLESTQELYNSLIQKAREAGVASAMRATSVRVIDEARPPAVPYSPNLPLNGAIGFSGALLLAVGIVLVRDRDTYLGAQGSEPALSNLRELGAIPSAKRNQALTRPSGAAFNGSRDNAAVELVTWQEPPSVLTEAFRATLASILFSPGFQRQHGVLTITSVQPLEGKTTTISNLAIALTETHGRVLLIDADLRRPRIHKIFDQVNDKGLTTLLSSAEPVSAMNLKELIRETNIPGLFTLPSGPGAASITPLLYSSRMSAFLTRARAEFDFVLIDTPPASLFSDARILGRVSDAVILVVHASKTSRGDLRTTCQNFAKDGTHVLGTVVNHWNFQRRNRAYETYKPA